MAALSTTDESLNEETPLVNREDTVKRQFKMAVREWLGQISKPVYLLVMFFAISSWVDVNGLWVELPLLVNQLPEGWNLPSYLAVIIQVANIGPIIYTVANRLAPNKVKEWPVIYIIILTGATACMLLAFFWKTTTWVGGAEHSTALISLAALLALVDCTSSVVYLPYMAVFKAQYMTALYVGEGLSGLIPGLVGLAQSVGSDPKCVNESITIHNATTGLNHTEWQVVPVYPKPSFSVEVFFFFLFAMMVVSGLAFTLLHWLPYCRGERIRVQLSHVESSHFVYSKAGSQDGNHDGREGGSHDQSQSVPGKPHINGNAEDGYVAVPHSSTEPLEPKINVTQSHFENRDEDGRNPNIPRLSKGNFYLLLALTAWLNSLTNGILASTQSFSVLPYSNLAYSLAVRLSTVANPLACIVALFVICRSARVVTALTAVGTVLAGYQVYLAASSPTPPLVGTSIGEFLAVSTAVLLTGIFSYVKVSIASILQAEGRRALLWCGFITQAGSFFGAVFAFILVNVMNLFVSIPACSQ